MVGDFITMKTTSFFKLRLLTSFFRITSSQVINEKLLLIDSFSWIRVYVYPCCLTAWYKSKMKSKVVFNVLIYIIAYHRIRIYTSKSGKYPESWQGRLPDLYILKGELFFFSPGIIDLYYVSKNTFEIMLIFLAEDCKYSFNSMFDFIVKNKSIPTRLKYKKAIIVQNKKNI